mmetsp:Transcript_84259/g.236869  ORF Transcript_84259/g.236869 Transcript_84259/m.236869 type:complete len:294 (-) Transcript_84259:275-1156(-)
MTACICIRGASSCPSEPPAGRRRRWGRCPSGARRRCGRTCRRGPAGSSRTWRAAAVRRGAAAQRWAPPRLPRARARICVGRPPATRTTTAPAAPRLCHCGREACSDTGESGRRWASKCPDRCSHSATASQTSPGGPPPRTHRSLRRARVRPAKLRSASSTSAPAVPSPSARPRHHSRRTLHADAAPRCRRRCCTRCACSSLLLQTPCRNEAGGFLEHSSQIDMPPSTCASGTLRFHSRAPWPPTNSPARHCERSWRASRHPSKRADPRATTQQRKPPPSQQVVTLPPQIRGRP